MSQTMYTSYAKDIFIALVDKWLPEDKDEAKKMMKAAISLIKQARDAFA